MVSLKLTHCLRIGTVYCPLSSGYTLAHEVSAYAFNPRTIEPCPAAGSCLALRPACGRRKPSSLRTSNRGKRVVFEKGKGRAVSPQRRSHQWCVNRDAG